MAGSADQIEGWCNVIQLHCKLQAMPKGRVRASVAALDDSEYGKALLAGGQPLLLQGARERREWGACFVLSPPPPRAPPRPSFRGQFG